MRSRSGVAAFVTVAFVAAVIGVTVNRVSKRAYGVRAATMTDSVTWLVRDLRTSDVRERVYYDESVSNKPES